MLGSNNVEGYWNILWECVYERELVIVFDYYKILEIDVVIFKSLFKGEYILFELCIDLENLGVIFFLFFFEKCKFIKFLQ